MNTHLKIIIALIAISISGRAYTQGDTIVWEQKASLPGTGRIDYASFVIDSNYYIIGGLDSSYFYYNEVWRYNIPRDTWQRMNNFPGGYVIEPTGFAANGVGYVCCGTDSFANGAIDSTLWVYDPNTDSWQHKANFPGISVEAPISFVYGNYAFIGMGLWQPSDIWRYNIIADSWDSIPSLPEGNRTLCGVSVIDSFVYILTGWVEATGSDFPYQDIWRYEINRNQWDSIGLMPGLPRSSALFWTFDSVIIGGYGGAKNSLGGYSFEKDIYKYQPLTNKWNTLSCIDFLDSIADDNTAGCFVFGSKGYFFGGYKTIPNFSYYNNMWSFDATPLLSYTGINTVTADEDFKVYPNPASHENGFSISTSESGSILFYDALGRTLDERKLMCGLNQIKFTTGDEVIFYHAILSSGATENGKVVFIK